MGGRTPLTEAQVLELRALRTYHGWSEGRLASRYGLNRETTRRIVDGLTYAKLRYEVPADAAAAIEEHARARDCTTVIDKST